MDKQKKIIEDAWEGRGDAQPGQAQPLRDARWRKSSPALDAGKLRVAEKSGGEWITHQWIKKAVLLSFRLEDNRGHGRGPLLRQGAVEVRDYVRLQRRAASASCRRPPRAAAPTSRRTWS